MARSTVRVQIPRNPSKLLLLAQTIYAKHQADAADSALGGLQDVNWEDNGDKIAQAQLLDEKVKQMQKDMEKMYGQRDLLLQTVLETVKASRNMLKGIYSANLHKLGDWGFTVDSSPKGKKGGNGKKAG